MPLNIGFSVGHYDVTALIGEGGMGQVYRARDTKLNRDVALKVLPDAFASDPDRLARFQREAQVLASLNHPNIAAIYGLEEADGVRVLVELVEGPDPGRPHQAGADPARRGVAHCQADPEALEAAHEQGGLGTVPAPSSRLVVGLSVAVPSRRFRRIRQCRCRK